MKLYYGAYKIGDEKILKVCDSNDCMSPNILLGTFGILDSEKVIGISRKLAGIAQIIGASAIEFITENDFRTISVR